MKRVPLIFVDSVRAYEGIVSKRAKSRRKTFPEQIESALNQNGTLYKIVSEHYHNITKPTKKTSNFVIINPAHMFGMLSDKRAYPFLEKISQKGFNNLFVYWGHKEYKNEMEELIKTFGGLGLRRGLPHPGFFNKVFSYDFSENANKYFSKIGIWGIDHVMPIQNSSENINRGTNYRISF